MNTPVNVVDWLLEPSNPSMRYRTMAELLDIPEDDPAVLFIYNGVRWKSERKTHETRITGYRHPKSFL